jgi:hypothetical protein
MEMRQEKVGKEETQMSAVSWFEPGLVVGQALCFPRGSEERQGSGPDAHTPTTSAKRCGHLPWLSVKREGQLSQRLWTISAIALDKQ